MSALVTLPTEILREVFDQLVPDVVVTGTTPPLPEKHQLCQRALWSLALVSHHIGGIATEFLYKNIAIVSTKKMVCLFRTFHHQSKIRKYPHYLANFVQLVDSELQEEIEADIQQHFPLLPVVTANSAQVYPPELYQLDSPELFSCKPLWTHEIIRYMLAMLPCLKDILMLVRGVKIVVPPDSNIDKAFFTETPKFLPFSGEPRALRIQWHMCRYEDDDSDRLLDPLFQLYFAPYISNGCRVTDLRFLHLANVTSYTVNATGFSGLDPVFSTDRFMSSEKNRDFLSWLAQLEALHLRGSSVDPLKMRQLLAACPNLRRLTWGYLVWPRENAEPNTSQIESALQQTAGHLEELSFKLDILYGPVCFRHFRALKVLMVGIEVFANHCQWSDDVLAPPAAETPLVSLLPESLVHLTLISPITLRSDTHHGGTRSVGYSDIMGGYVAHGRELLPSWLADSLEEFSHSCQAMPNLRKVTVIQAFRGDPPVDYRWEIEIGNLTAGFGAAGVSFLTRIAQSNQLPI